ncbi:MAG: hypothetical protein WDW38_006151 [Sanguina aurantia]
MTSQLLPGCCPGVDAAVAVPSADRNADRPDGAAQSLFHWHLADDQGWRIEIRRYPQLTAIGAWRTPIDAGHDGPASRLPPPALSLAACLHRPAACDVTVVPPIDMPGHAQAAVAAYQPSLGVTGANSAVMSSRGTQGAIDAARLGHDVVLALADLLRRLQQRPHRWWRRAPAGDDACQHLRIQTSPRLFDASQASHVLGAQANVWTEHMPTMKLVDLVLQDLDALSEVDWSPAATLDWQGFLARLLAQLARYRAQDIGYADSAFAPDITVDRAAALSGRTVQLSLTNQVHDGEIRYTLDDSQATARSSGCGAVDPATHPICPCPAGPATPTARW